jgi:hypothetical protein
MPGSWSELNDALKQISPTGASGFESLVGDLLRAFTKQSFFLARTGDQPSGDVYSPDKGIVVQVKRYTSTEISEKEIVGDVNQAIDTVADLDLYVVVATRHTGQLAAKLEGLSTRSGIDIVTISLVDVISDLGSLCIAHWQIVRPYFPQLDDSWVRWAENTATDERVTSHIDALRAAFQSAHTRTTLAKQCLAALKDRFSNDHVLDDAVSRETIRTKLTQWWDDGSVPITALEGEEGNGKSWAAASFAYDISRRDNGVAFWLDSHLWTDAKTPERILDLCLENVVTGDENLRKKIKRKIIFQWTAPILIVLDGANERSAHDATESILCSYRSHSDRLHRQIRLLFTTRPLAVRSSVFQQLWIGYTKIEMVPFSLEELNQALLRLGGNVIADELPQSVREMARIPRYLKLCVELRNELASFSHVTKELLLWVDLCRKVSQADPQMRAIEETIAATPEELLSELAKRSGWPTSDTVSVPKKTVMDVFPDFDSIRADLIEQRIVLSSSTPSTVQLSGSHVVLGWALWLRQVSDQKHDSKREALRDELLKELEPAPSNDLKAKALHIASLLSYLDTSKPSPQQTRSLLFELWIRHHNAVFTITSLECFVERDLLAYASAIEGLFANHFQGYLETQLTLPLLRIWRDDLPQRTELRVILERWLTFIFPGGREGSSDRDVDPPVRFPVANTAEQLRLAYVAISIISFRPERDLISVLVDSYHSQDFCHGDFGNGASTHRIPVKWCCEALGYLMRWSYDESMIDDLAAMASDPKLSSPEKENVGWFARLFRMASLPMALGEQGDVFSGGEVTPSQDLANLEAFLSDAPPPNGRKLIGFGSLGAWVVRQDLPSLSQSGVAALQAEMKFRSANPDQAVYSGTWENKEFEDLVTWAAKYAPSALETVAVNWWTIQIGKSNFNIVISTLVALGIAHTKLAGVIDDVLAKLPLNQSLHDLDLLSYVVTPITEMVMLHGTHDQIAKWFHYLEDKSAVPLESPIVSLLPLPTIVNLLSDKEFSEYAKVQARRLATEWQMAPSTVNVQVLAFWLETCAYSSLNDDGFAEFAVKLARNPNVPENLSFPLFLVAGCSTKVSTLMDALQCPLFDRFKEGYNSWRWGLHLGPSQPLSVTYSELRNAASLTVSGWLLFNLNSPEFKQWGEEVVEQALASVEKLIESPVQCIVVQQIREDGRLGYVSHERLPMGEASHHSIHSATWGVDRSSETKSPTNEQFKAASEAVEEEVDRRHALPSKDIVGFNAFQPLREWAAENKSKFCDSAFDYLTAFRKLNSDRRQESANFAFDVFIILLQFDPQRALSFRRNEFGDLHVIDGDWGLPWSNMVVWTRDLDHMSEILQLRTQYLTEAANDEVVLQHVLAARRGDVDIEAIALELLQATRAKERALAVTLLGFLGTASAIATLSKLQEDDQSLWVRSQARWAFEVCITENHCQEWYMETLRMPLTLSQLEARLVAMEPALSPSSAVWRHKIKEQSDLEKWESRVRGHLELFWRRIEHNSFREGVWEIFGRRLSEYCRGEKLKEGITSQQSPWWKPLE